ncbi:septum formation initiator family protein [Faecalibacterium prausnitzii]|nr:septum formation initiator family protein [Faecalibacterium prausnitzii]
MAPAAALMVQVLLPARLLQEVAACAVLGAALGAVRAFLPVRGRAAFVPDVLLPGAVLLVCQSYAAGYSKAGVLRWYMVATAFAAALCVAGVLGIPLRALGRGIRAVLCLPGRILHVLRCSLCAAAALRLKLPANYAGTRKEPQKNPKRTCQTSGHCCIIQTYQSKRTDAEGLLFRQERKAMTNTGRKKRRKNAVVTMAFRLFFVLLLLSMLAAYISNQVTISSKRAELETLNEQVAQQQTENQELQRVLSGDADQITEWVARDSYNYAAPNERIFVDVTGN